MSQHLWDARSLIQLQCLAGALTVEWGIIVTAKAQKKWDAVFPQRTWASQYLWEAVFAQPASLYLWDSELLTTNPIHACASERHNEEMVHLFP
jgi:hypothetical protein